jgi:hypothetical protein
VSDRAVLRGSYVKRRRSSQVMQMACPHVKSVILPCFRFPRSFDPRGMVDIDISSSSGKIIFMRAGLSSMGSRCGSTRERGVLSSRAVYKNGIEWRRMLVWASIRLLFRSGSLPT